MWVTTKRKQTTAQAVWFSVFWKHAKTHCLMQMSLARDAVSRKLLRRGCNCALPAVMFSSVGTIQSQSLSQGQLRG